MYTMFVQPEIGRFRIQTLKKSDIKRFYNMLVEERGLKISTVDNVHTVLHQVLTAAVEDGYMRMNVSDNVLKELKQALNIGAGRRRALTMPEQELFLEYLNSEKNRYFHWYPIFAVMIGTGMRVGEITGLRWCDIDLEEGIIEVNHTLVYYDHAKDGCYFNVHTPKTEAGRHRIPMLDYVKEAFQMERRYQGTLNKALRRIIRDCNEDQLARGMKEPVLLPKFSCHSLRHTFTTRLVEEGVNIKVVQDGLGHKDVATTLNIYTDVTKELKKKEFDSLQKKMGKKRSRKPADE